jgi:hypothetical protein
VIICLLLLVAPITHAARIQTGAVVNLPYQFPDGKSPAWIVQNGGWLQQRPVGGGPNGFMEMVYNQTGVLNIDGNGLPQTNNQARVDPKTGELICDSFQPVNGVQISRRVEVRRDDDVVRCIDVFKTLGGDATIGLQYTMSLNRQVTAGQTISDPRKGGSDMGWVGQTMRGRTAVEMFAGKGAATSGSVQWEQGNNVMQYNMQLEVPAGKTVAVMHLHAITTTPDKGAEMINSVKLSRIVSDVPADIRKAIVNFRVNSNFVGDREVLRGTLFDVVELRSGDSLFGTLQEDSYKLKTDFGDVQLPAQKVVGLLNIGQFRPRTLIVSTEGEMIGGTLEKQTVDLQLGSGQVTQIPLSQISRVGYRKRADEADEWKFDKPMVLLASGDRMNVQMPDQPIDVMTRYGSLKLSPASISSITFQGDQPGVHQIVLNNGSKFAGLVTADQIPFDLATMSIKITLPTAAIARLQFSPDAPDVADGAATTSLSSGDVFVGTITGELKLDTAFDTLKIPASQVRSMSRVKESTGDVQVVLWDQTKLTGQLESHSLTCDVGDGIKVNLPVPLVDTYAQPSPMPPDQMIDKIKAIIKKLSDDDWKTRDQAQADLVAMGQTVVPVLKKLRDDQGPEAQQRIDAILKQFEKPSSSAKAQAAADAPQ